MDKHLDIHADRNISNESPDPHILKLKYFSGTHVDGNCCSNFAFIEDAISCSVVKLAIASCAAIIANSCIPALIKEVFTTDLALIFMLSDKRRLGSN